LNVVWDKVCVCVHVGVYDECVCVYVCAFSTTCETDIYNSSYL